MHKNTYWTADAVREFNMGNITPDGVIYSEELHSSEGMVMLLLRKSTQTLAELRKAERYLIHHRDVVSVSWNFMKPEDEAKLAELQGALEKQEEEMTGEQKIELLRGIAKNGYGWVGKQQVDSFSASAIVQIYDALQKPENKEKYIKFSVARMADIAFKLMNQQKGG